MRSGLVVVTVLLLGAGAARAEGTWAEWVGDYAGKLAWRSCAAPGAKSATIAIDAVDGALVVDLARAGGGLRDLSAAEDLEVETLSAQQGDVTLAIARTRPGTITLAIDLASGCTVRGTLTRASTRVPACDRALALARIERACTKLPAASKVTAPLAPPAKGWRSADAGRCTRTGDTLSTALVDAGCLPVPDAAGTMVGAPCRQMVQEAEALKRCPNAPPSYTEIANRLVELARPAPVATRQVVEASCMEGHQMLVELASYVHCPL